MHRLDPLGAANSFPASSAKSARRAHRGSVQDSAEKGPGSRKAKRRPARVLLTAFLEGPEGMPPTSEDQRVAVTRDLATAALCLSEDPEGKQIVRFYDHPWELCIERFGATAILSVYLSGNDPSVTVYDHPVPFEEWLTAVEELLVEARAKEGLPEAVAADLNALAHRLRTVDRSHLRASSPLPRPTPLLVEGDKEAPVTFAAEFRLRPRHQAPKERSVERADLHALLFRGRLTATVRGRRVDLGEAHPFLFAESLLGSVQRVLEGWELGQSLQLRSEMGGILVGLRLSTGGSASLTLRVSGVQGDEQATYTFPNLAVTELVEATLFFGRALVRTLLRHHRAQHLNLRLSSFRRHLKECGEALRESRKKDAKLNPSPESYRAYAPPPADESESRKLTAVRLRYAPRWTAHVPGIDLGSTFLCGERLILGGSQEMSAVHRLSGEILWTVPIDRAASVVTPSGIARLHEDGRLTLHELERGTVVLDTKVARRLGGIPSGSSVHLPGVPRLLLATEGEKYLIAIDLTTGELRWRFALAQRGVLRAKRSGRLLYVASGDSALTALDVSTGSLVWRHRDRLRFQSAPAVLRDDVYAVAGGVGGSTRVHAFDAFSGASHWVYSLRAGERRGVVEGAPLVSNHMVAIAVREAQGLRFLGLDRKTGDLRWASRGVVAPAGTSWLPVDDLFIGNSPTGELLAIEASTGAVRYRRSVGRALETDVPRRLEPVLRSGALFVPYTDVSVLRPRDGTCIATIASSEALPDLLRVDENCDVYLAEESGHVVAYSAGTRLSVVGR